MPLLRRGRLSSLRHSCVRARVSLAISGLGTVISLLTSDVKGSARARENSRKLSSRSCRRSSYVREATNLNKYADFGQALWLDCLFNPAVASRVTHPSGKVSSLSERGREDCVCDSSPGGATALRSGFRILRATQERSSLPSGAPLRRVRSRAVCAHVEKVFPLERSLARAQPDTAAKAVLRPQLLYNSRLVKYRGPSVDLDRWKRQKRVPSSRSFETPSQVVDAPEPSIPRYTSRRSPYISVSLPRREFREEARRLQDFAPTCETARLKVLLLYEYARGS